MNDVLARPLLFMAILVAAALSGGALHPLGLVHAQTPPFGLTERPPLNGVTFPFTQPAVSGDVRIVRAFPNVSFNAPLYVTAQPGNNNDLFVVEQGGVIRRIANAPNASSAPVFLDLTDRVQGPNENSQELGLLGLAFHPQYQTNGFFYVFYTPRSVPKRTVLSRFRRSSSSALLGDGASEQILLVRDQPFFNHDGGCLQFGPDGKLYIASGDGGSGDDPFNNAQNLGSLLGKMLRLNDDGSIPSDNPFVNQSGLRGEIWAYGLRNSWRFSFDPATGSLWLGDVGQNAFEEVDIIRRGGNYGWRVYEGNRSNINPSGLPPSAFDQPVYVYPRSSSDPNVPAGVSITGGYVYRGAAIPSLVGKYLFADFGAGRVWALNQVSGVVQGAQFISSVPLPSSFGTDNAQNLYITSFDGHVYKIERNPGGGGPFFPQSLSQTGLFTDTLNLVPNPGLIEYQLNAPLWSDGSLKRRWIGLPNGSAIGFTAAQAWTWPARALVVKHFEIDLANGTRKRLETRVLLNEDQGWKGYTYRWNDAGTDADLLPDARTSVDLDVLDPDSPNGFRRQTYEFPSRTDCLRCHTTVAGTILGARTSQLQRNFLYPNGVTDNQLRAFNHVHLFSTDIGDHQQYGALTDPANTSAPLASRARAYLESNCAQCHQPGAPVNVTLDLRAAISNSQLNAIDVRPSAGNLGLSDAFLIAPGDKERSVLWERMRRLDGTRMPPIASHVVDTAGLNLIGQWIDALVSEPDTTPNGFSFSNVAGVPVSSTQTSNSITVAGINAAAPISVSGGSYSIGCNATFTSAASTIVSGQNVCVRHTSSAASGTTVTTTLNIGGVAGSFSSTTAGALFQVRSVGVPSKCLQPEDGNPSIGDLISAKSCNAASAAQALTFPVNANGSFRMMIGSLCIGTSTGGFANGARLQLQACNGGTTQNFLINAGRYAAANAPNQVMDLHGQNLNDVIFWVDYGVSNQRWNQLPLSGSSPPDTTPNPFAFTNVTGVPLGSTQTSNAITVSGINAAAPISVSGGSHSIGCTATFSTAAGTINSGQTVCVRHTASATNATTVTTTLNIGGVTGSFGSTTVGAAPPPGGSFQVQNQRSTGSCLQPEDGSASIGDPMSAKTCNAGSAAQRLTFPANADGSFRMTIGSLCIGTASGNFSNGSRLQLQTCNGSTAQNFVINAGRYAAANATNQVMDLHGQNLNDVIFWMDYGGTNQRWTQRPVTP
ncbi:MAG: PQQ-dependent sugar dehydrogenase [Panacagrimonas sp.]